MTQKIEWHPRGTPGPWREGQTGTYETALLAPHAGRMVAYAGWSGGSSCELTIENPVDFRAIAEVPAMVKALRVARQFITNGIEFGYIQMPDAATPDSAHDTLPMIEAVLRTIDGEG